MLFLHITLMFVAFALTAGTGVMMTFIADSGDPRAVVVAGGIMRRLGMVGGISLVLGLLFGFGTASKLGYPLSSTWLVAAYACVVLIVVIGFAVFQPWAARLRTAAEANDTAALQKIAKEPLPRIGGPLSGMLWIVVIAMMVLKP